MKGGVGQRGLSGWIKTPVAERIWANKGVYITCRGCGARRKTKDQCDTKGELSGVESPDQGQAINWIHLSLNNSSQIHRNNEQEHCQH
jgi:hypothetical protein